MIRVTVELIPMGTGRPRLLGVAEISKSLLESNTNTADGALGDYNVKLSKWAPMEDQTWKQGKVVGFDRKKHGSWDLLFVALRDCVGSRNPPKKE